VKVGIIGMGIGMGFGMGRNLYVRYFGRVLFQTLPVTPINNALFLRSRASS
jgi:3-hydroxyisobutyrate dehydrogenase-like beta-hydroxyacid dehydrogenase